MRSRKLLVGALIVPLWTALLFVQPSRARAADGAVIINPLMPVGPDPWVEYKDGYYYFMRTTVTDLTLWRTRSMAELKTAEKKVLWTPPATGPYSHDIWAP